MKCPNSGVFTNNYWVGWVRQSNFEWNSIIYNVNSFSFLIAHHFVRLDEQFFGHCQNIFPAKMAQPPRKNWPLCLCIAFNGYFLSRVVLGDCTQMGMSIILQMLHSLLFCNDEWRFKELDWVKLLQSVSGKKIIVAVILCWKCFRSHHLNSSWVELNASHGHESYSHKAFMRNSGKLFFVWCSLSLFCWSLDV